MEKKINIGVLCPSEIAFRRFMPSLKKIKNVSFYGIAHANEEEWFGSVSKQNDLSILQSDLLKAEKFIDTYGGKLFHSFKELILSKEVDAIYIPLPPSLHYKWAKFALMNNKHVLLEKPSTTAYKFTKELIDIASIYNLAVHENYMFNFHSQLNTIEKLIHENSIGKIRLYRIAFGFPFRGKNDFRYNKKLGGGALLDCGGYTVKLACRLLGNTTQLVYHHLNYEKNYDVDLYGSGVLKNNDGAIAQISFGMDNSYKCELEIWGSEGTIYTNRIMTAPDGFEPIITIKKGDVSSENKIESDDSFKKSIEHFVKCIESKKIREENYKEILLQAKLIDEFKEED